MIEEPNNPTQVTDLQTRWAFAVGGTGDARKEALRDLAASYWYCVYAWWRRAGLDPANAATATVASFTRWLGKYPPDASDSGVARMREWLPKRLAKLAEDGVEMEGPGALEIDAEWAEQRYAGEPAGEPDAIFQRVWALTLLEFTVSTLRTEYVAREEETLFGELLLFAGFESVTDERYADAGERVGRSSGAMRKAVFDFRTRQREILRAIATDTLLDPADTDSELTMLLCAIDAPGIDATPLPSAIGGLRPEEALVRAMQSVRMTGVGRGIWQPPRDSEVARLFPQFEILGLIGRGGMGAVYKARQVDLDRVVAIKLLPLEVSVDRDFAERFRREARAMAKLSHPHIITVFDFGTTNEGHLYFVMEFVEGASLHDMIRKVGIEPAQALALAAQVCTALAYAHEKGIVHRDIKPANVMVDLAGQAKVADFGLARLTESGTGQSGYTVTGAVLGTPDYMAPEQKHGTRVDHRADVYSVGVMLYEMLCRETPQGAFDPPSKRIGCDTRIDTIVLKAMQQAPDHRYQSTQEMRAAVASALTPSKTAPQRRFGPSPPVPKVEPPRRGLPLVRIALVIVAALAGFVIYENSKAPQEITADSENMELTPPVVPTPPKTEEPKPVPSETTDNAAPKTADALSATPVPSATPAPVALSETAKWLAVQVPQWQAAFAAEVNAPFEKSVAGLKQQYLASLEKQLAAFAKAAKLDDAVVFRAERDEMVSGGEMPAQDEATVPASLKALRAGYRASFAKLDTERFAKAKIVHARYDTILAQSQTALTQRQRLDEALEMKAQRDALSAAWLQPPAGAASNVPAVVVSATPKDGAALSGRAPLASAVTIKDAFTNILGMRLVPVPGTDVLFCIHETRRKDYAAYAVEVPGVNGEWRSQQHDGLPVGDQDNHPVVAVSWDDARAFCEWLSKKEGKTYRLPTDEEWSFAVGLGRLERFGKNNTPETLDGKVTGEFPWGGNLPLKTKDNAGNFADIAFHEKFPVAEWIERYSDGYVTTAPVMSFKPNKLGIYDLGGNVWEWVEDWFEKEQTKRTLRGACWWDPATRLLSSHRGHLAANTREPHHGFRVVVENRVPATAASALAKPGATPPPAPVASGTTATNPPAPSTSGAAAPKTPLFIPTYTQPWQTPLRAAGVESKNFGKLPDGTWVVDLDFAAIKDIKTLSGVPISRLRAGLTEVSDLTPLRGIALKELWLPDTKVTDLTPLKGMPLQILSLKGTMVTDLSALRGMPLTSLKLHDCPDLTDLSPLAELKGLTDLSLPPNVKDIEFLRAFPKLERLSFNVDRQNGDRAKQTAAEFWKKYDSEAWVRTLRAAGIVESKLQEKEDGTWHVNLEGSTVTDLAILRGAPISLLELGGLAVSDLEPLRGMSLKFLKIFNTKVTDLSPIKGMPLDYLHMSGIKVTDLSPLRGMPLTGLRLHSCTELTDISPLADCRELTNVTLPPNAKNIEFLRTFPKLARLSYSEVSRRDPDKTAVEFWQEYDTQGWLRTLRASNFVKAAKQLPDGTYELDLSETQFRDLALLKGVPISRLVLRKTAVTDFAPLRGMAALTSLDLRDMKAFTDLSPLQGLPLQHLYLGYAGITDLSPLRGMAFINLEVSNTKVADLSPLKGMPLQTLNVAATAVTDLEPLRGMPLASLWINSSKVTDLRPLEGMSLRYLHMSGTGVKNLTPLRSMPLTDLKLHSCNDITDLSPIVECKELGTLTLPPNTKNIDVVRSLPKLLRLDFSEASGRPPRPAFDFWQQYDSQGWLRAVREGGFGLRDARQLPDGTWDVQLASSTISDLTILKGAPISILNLGQSSVTDLTPLRGMAIKDLKIYKTQVTDLSPLQGMAIQQLNLGGMKVTDLSALRGMPLTLLKLHECPSLTDLSPLADAKELIDLTLPPKAKDIEFLRAFPKLERISFKEGPSGANYRPTLTAAEFWKEYDAKKK